MAPEIWQATSGKITHFVAGGSTGGTITGCARYFRRANPGGVQAILAGAEPPLVIALICVLCAHVPTHCVVLQTRSAQSLRSFTGRARLLRLGRSSLSRALARRTFQVISSCPPACAWQCVIACAGSAKRPLDGAKYSSAGCQV